MRARRHFYFQAAAAVTDDIISDDIDALEPAPDKPMTYASHRRLWASLELLLAS